MESRQFRFLALFGMLIVVNKLLSMIFAQRVIAVFGVILPGGIIPFCTIFLILDVVTNHYKYENAKKLIFFNLICEAAMTLLIYFTLKINPSPLFKFEEQFITIMGSMTDIFIASAIATFVSYYLNCYVFSRLYFSFEGKYLWLRCVISTALGELVFSMIWTPLYFWNKLGSSDIYILVINQYLFKVAFEVATLPLTYFLVYLLSKYEIPVSIKYKGFSPNS